MKKCTGCGSECDSMFCQLCGTRVTENKFIGLSFFSIIAVIDDNTHASSWNRAAIQEEEKRHKKAMEPLLEKQDEIARTMRDLHEAREFARKHKIGVM